MKDVVCALNVDTAVVLLDKLQNNNFFTFINFWIRMDKKILGVITGIAIVIALAVIILNFSDSEIITTQKTNEKIGLVINSPKN